MIFYSESKQVWFFLQSSSIIEIYIRIASLKVKKYCKPSIYGLMLPKSLGPALWSKGFAFGLAAIVCIQYSLILILMNLRFS